MDSQFAIVFWDIYLFFRTSCFFIVSGEIHNQKVRIDPGILSGFR